MIKFLFWTILIILLLRWLLKPFLKVIVTQSVKKMAEEMHKRQYEQQYTPRYPEGSIRVESNPGPKNSKKPNRGPSDEYVDYEEVK